MKLTWMALAGWGTLAVTLLGMQPRPRDWTMKLEWTVQTPRVNAVAPMAGNGLWAAARSIRRVIASPADPSVFAVGGERGASLWKLTPAGYPVRMGNRLTDPVEDMAFSPDGSRLWIAGEDMTKIYRLE